MYIRQMGGKNKHRGKHNHRANNQTHQPQQYAPKMTEDDLCELVAEATDLHVLINARHQQLKKVEEFAYLLSTKWLREWKDYVGYDDLFAEDNSKGKKKIGKKRPGPPNTDLIAPNRDYFLVSQDAMPEYTYLNKVLKQKMSEPEDYIAVTPQLWQKFTRIYGAGQEIKRPIRKKKNGNVFVDGQLMKADFILIDYGQQELLQKLCHAKTKDLDDLLPNNSFQMSTIWKLADLYSFLQMYCETEYGSKQIKIWKCQNYIGLRSLQEQFAKSVKDKTYQINAYQLNLDDQVLQDLDLDDFIKSQYTLIVEIADSKINTAQLPQEIFGYCEECVEKKKLIFSCECNRIHYCSRECQSDDQVWHFTACKAAFDSEDDEQFRKKKGVKPSKCGLKNLGNTCYMNSSIQLFVGLSFLTDYICGSKTEKIANKEEEDSQMFIEKIAKTCKLMGQVKKLQYIAPWSFKSQINYFLPSFKGYKQHDAIDFLTGFLNTLNQCLKKPKQEVYTDLFKQNMMGKFDSLVICPQCDNQVKNQEDFLQLTLPIKPKVNKLLFNYAKFENPLICTFGKAEALSTWASTLKQIGVSEDTLVLMGKQGEEELQQIDFTEDCQKKLKKTKKDVLIYPNEKIDREKQIWIGSSLIIVKNVCGQQMKVVSGYPFPIIIQSNKSVGHIFIQILKKFNTSPQLGLKLEEIESEYEEIMRKKLEKIGQVNQRSEVEEKEEKCQKQGKKESSKVEIEKVKEDKQNKLDEIETQIDQMMKSLNSKLIKIIEENFKMKAYIQDRKRIKNICFYCKKKCNGCLISPLFQQMLCDYFSHKLRDSNINIYFQDKLQPIKQKHDVANNGDSTLQECLMLFGEPEQLDQENAWWCSKCQDLRLAYKQMHINKFPKYLLIQLNRFKNGANGKVKNNDPIQYNEFQTFGDQKYRLLTSIVHQGSLEGGHYWAIGLRENQYFQFNDDRVTKTDKICNKGAYILCYRREEQ